MGPWKRKRRKHPLGTADLRNFLSFGPGDRSRGLAYRSLSQAAASFSQESDLFVTSAAIAFAVLRPEWTVDDFKPGDVIGFSHHSLLGTAINLGTFGIPLWSLSHVAIVTDFRGERLLFESTSHVDSPCRIARRHVEGVQAQEPVQRIKHYHGSAWHYPTYRPLYDCEQKRLNDFLIANMGKHYDRDGAIHSGGLVYSLIWSMLRLTDLSSLFCSELVAAAHSHIGLFATSNPSRWNPNRLARAERRAGILGVPRRLK